MRETAPETAVERRKRESLRRQQHEEDVKAVMATPSGRRFIWHLLEEVTGVFAPSFAGEALLTARNEGRRWVGIHVMLEAQRLARDSYTLLMGEQLANLELQPPDGAHEDEAEEE